MTLKQSRSGVRRWRATNRAKLLSEMGVRLRLARERRGMTLRGAARSLGVSPSFMSQVEHGKIMPSVNRLYSIANGLGLAIGDLIRSGDSSRKGSRVVESIGSATELIERRGNRKAMNLAKGVSWERLTAWLDAEIEFLYVVYDPGVSSCPEDLTVGRGGKGCVYVVSGQLGLEVGLEDFKLRAGDSVSWLAHTKYRVWTIGDEPAVAIWAILPATS